MYGCVSRESALRVLEGRPPVPFWGLSTCAQTLVALVATVGVFAVRTLQVIVQEWRG